MSRAIFICSCYYFLTFVQLQDIFHYFCSPLSVFQSSTSSYDLPNPLSFHVPLMRSHHLWPRKSQNCIIPVNLEAIQTTTITSKLFRMLYLGYYRALPYIVYGLQLGNFDISLASSDLSAIFKYISLRCQITCNCCNPVKKQPHTTSGLNCSMFLAFHWSPQMV